MKKLMMMLGVLAIGLVLYNAGSMWAQTSADEAQIKALEQRFISAFRAKDLSGIMSVYEPGQALFVFDITPPRQHVGYESYKKDWEDFFALFDGPINIEMTELSVTTDGKLGFGHSIQHVWGTMKDGTMMNVYARVTDDYKKTNGKWLIVQEHVSVPVDLSTAKADLLSKTTVEAAH